MPPALEILESKLGHRFADASLRDLALTHRSWARPHGDDEHNERLEFLGDSVLGLIASERLLQTFPDDSEGVLTKTKARLVCAATLHEVALELELGPYLRLGPAEERNRGREKKGLLVDAVEALIGAVYLDAGLEAARKVVDALILTPARVEAARGNLLSDNPKSALQEILQGRKLDLPDYRVVAERGPEHDRTFRVELTIGGLFSAQAEGPTKRIAEQAAALQALNQREEWLPGEKTATPTPRRT